MIINDIHHEILIEALNDYKKWFDVKEDIDKINQIDSILKECDNKSFPIAFISKENIKVIKKIDNEDM